MSGVKDSGASKMLLISAFERVKNFSFTVLTHLDAEGVFAALPHDAREEIIIVLDGTYVNQVNANERRYFLVCPDLATYTLVSNSLSSNGITALPRIKVTFWKGITTQIEKREVGATTSCVPSDHQAGTIEDFADSLAALCPAQPQPATDARSHTTDEASVGGSDATSPTQPELAANASPTAAAVTADRSRRTVYGRARVDTITTLIVKFSGVPLSSLIALHKKNISSSVNPVTTTAPTPLDTLGPTGQPSCLQSIIDHERPWTRKAVKAAQQAASQEAKTLKREFREKYQPLVDKCRNDPRHTLTLDQAMHIINTIEDRYERKKWMVGQLREMRKLKKEVNAMVLEYLSLMAHCRKLQRVCIAAGNEAYNINIVLVEHPPSPFTSPAPTLP